MYVIWKRSIDTKEIIFLNKFINSFQTPLWHFLYFCFFTTQLLFWNKLFANNDNNNLFAFLKKLIWLIKFHNIYLFIILVFSFTISLSLWIRIHFKKESLKWYLRFGVVYKFTIEENHSKPQKDGNDKG